MNDLDSLLPSSVVVTFRRTDSAIPSDNLYAVTVTLGSLAITELGSATGHEGTKHLHSSAVAAFVGDDTATNQAEIDALARQVAEDWYLWQVGWVDAKYIGVVPWEPEGYDLIEFRHRHGEVTTRISRGPWQDTAEKMLQSSSAGEEVQIFHDAVFTGTSYFAGDISIDGGAITYNASTNAWTWNAVSVTYASSSTINVNGYVYYEGNVYYNPTTNTFTYYAGSTLTINSSSITVSGSSTYTYAAGSVLNLNGYVYVENNLWYDYSTNTFNYWSGSNITINSASVTVNNGSLWYFAGDMSYTSGGSIVFLSGSNITINAGSYLYVAGDATFGGPTYITNVLNFSNNSSINLTGTVYLTGTATLNVGVGITTAYYGCFQSYGCFYLNGCYHIIPQGTDTASFTTGGGSVEPDVPDYPWLFWEPLGDTTVPGFTGYADGKTFELTNDSTSKNITFKNEDGGATAAHRIRTPNQADYVVGPRSSVYFSYRAGSTNRWYVLDKLQSITGGGSSSGSAGTVQVADGSGGFDAATGVESPGGAGPSTFWVEGQAPDAQALYVDQGSAGTAVEIHTSSGLMFLVDDDSITLGSGAGVSSKIGFHNAAPTVQRAGAAQAAVATTAATNTAPYGFTTQAQADAIIALLNEIRAALVEKGFIKGSA